MGKGNKNKPSRDSSQKNVQQKDIFDVKENLKKLRSGTDTYSTKEPSFESLGKQHLSSEASTNLITGSQSYTSDKVDVLRDRIAMDLSIITQKLDDHKDKTNERFSGEISQLQKEIAGQADKFDTKISSFVTKEWFGGAIAVILVIAGIIYTLSYSNVLSDVEKLKTNQEETDRKVEKISIEREYDNHVMTDTLQKNQKEKK